MNPALSQHYREILVGLGEDPQREGLLDTPKRAAKAMQYLCHGYGQTLEEIVNGALFASDNDEMAVSYTHLNAACAPICMISMPKAWTKATTAG